MRNINDRNLDQMKWIYIIVLLTCIYHTHAYEHTINPLESYYASLPSSWYTCDIYINSHYTSILDICIFKDRTSDRYYREYCSKHISTYSEHVISTMILEPAVVKITNMGTESDIVINVDITCTGTDRTDLTDLGSGIFIIFLIIVGIFTLIGFVVLIHKLFNRTHITPAVDTV